MDLLFPASAKQNGRNNFGGTQQGPIRGGRRKERLPNASKELCASVDQWGNDNDGGTAWAKNSFKPQTRVPYATYIFAALKPMAVTFKKKLSQDSVKKAALPLFCLCCFPWFRLILVRQCPMTHRC